MLAVVAQPDPGVLAIGGQPTQAGQQDVAVADRGVQLERDPRANRDGRRGAGQVGEIRRRTLVEAYQAIVGPAAQVGQAQQPRAGAGIGRLDPGEQFVAGPERSYAPVGGVAIADGFGDGVQQHGVLTLLRPLEQANHGRIAPPSGKSGECRFR